MPRHHPFYISGRTHSEKERKQLYRKGKMRFSTTAIIVILRHSHTGHVRAKTSKMTLNSDVDTSNLEIETATEVKNGQK